MPGYDRVDDHEHEGPFVYGLLVIGGVQFLRGDKVLEPVRSANGWSHARLEEQGLDFGEDKENSMSNGRSNTPRRGHNILTFGPILREST